MGKHHLADSARGFIDAYAGILENAGLTHFSDRLHTIETSTVQRGPLHRCEHATMRHLDRLSSRLTDPAIRAATESLDWGQVYDGGVIDPALAEGMFAAQAAGTYGVFPSRRVATGLFLLAPGVYYPPHTHAAREVYHCLAGEINITHKLDEPAHNLQPGQSSETPSGRLHALQTGKQPVLIAYIWTGDLYAPTWWWEQNEQCQWQRTAWKRIPGESWKAAHVETVSPDDFDAAML